MSLRGRCPWLPTDKFLMFLYTHMARDVLPASTNSWSRCSVSHRSPRAPLQSLSTAASGLLCRQFISPQKIIPRCGGKTLVRTEYIPFTFLTITSPPPSHWRPQIPPVPTGISPSTGFGVLPSREGACFSTPPVLAGPYDLLWLRKCQ